PISSDDVVNDLAAAGIRLVPAQVYRTVIACGREVRRSLRGLERGHGIAGCGGRTRRVLVVDRDHGECVAHPQSESLARTCGHRRVAAGGLRDLGSTAVVAVRGYVIAEDLMALAVGLGPGCPHGSIRAGGRRDSRRGSGDACAGPHWWRVGAGSETDGV